MNGAVTAIQRLMVRYSHVNWALADQAMVSGANFLTGILLARYLGLAEYGTFTLAWMAVLFFNSLQSAVIISPMMSIGPKHDEAGVAEYYGAVFLQQLLWTGGSFFLLLLGVWISQFYHPEWRIKTLAFPLALSLATYQLQDFLRRYFFVRSQALSAFINDAVSYLGQLIFLLIFCHYTMLDTKGALWVVAGTSFAAICVGAFSVGRLCYSRATLAKTTAQHWRFSKWLTASALLRWTSGNLFTVAAASFLGAEAAGAMRAAQNILGVMQVLFLGLGNVVPVRAARIFRESGINDFTTYLKKVAVCCTGLAALYCFMVSIAPDLVMQLVYGNNYFGYGYLLRLYAVTYVIISLGSVSIPGLIVLENTKPVFWAYVLTSIISVVSASKIVKTFGLVGAVTGDMTVQGIFHVVLMLALLRTTRSVKYTYT